MFRAEFDTNFILVESVADDTFERYHVSWVSLDPARLTKIFINLLTNAVKFTKLEAVREITVRTSAFIDHVLDMDNSVWFPAKKQKRVPMQSSQGNGGEPINLLFSVSDTGRRISNIAAPRSRALRLTRAYRKHRRRDRDDYSTGKRKHRILRASTSSSGSRWSCANPPLVGLVAHLVACSLNSSNGQVAHIYNANRGTEALDFLPRTRVWHDCQPIQKIETPSSNLDLDIDCILMDVEMPVLDGLHCTWRIRALQHKGKLKRHIHIIAITANARAEQIEGAFEAGVDDILPRPFRVVELLGKLESYRKKDKSSVNGE
ncbi:uncharacterized protein Z519_03633 [Cladophialophora bantiana CBS 173.52]|uniref:Response regulatory domain-containing protein n=1 Tax=Cladophialophora bantiana (strain ATCC 10958 / CBS 173.52 / CDC B-1940 / NIH 8579) TaxID=1442370 RepID=A0A0D2G904_CLAB1|nr:uncharacterized protein Z519_03633 [Cladophialophora bantiana CBS 173.52]KIW95052.1 hypothetical protein Z519_03633 [Cladophialophora bantiana CBS 173.52]